MKQLTIWASVILLAGVVCVWSGCEAGQGTNVSGHWDLVDALGNTMTLDLQQFGNSVTGQGEGYGLSFPVVGTVQGDTLLIDVQGGGHDITIAGQVDGDNMNGTVSDATTGFSTTFRGTRTSG